MENLDKILIQLKLKYFSSRYFSLKNWINFDGIKLPDGLTLSDIENWPYEKQLYLAQEKVNMELIRESYQHILLDRLDTMTALTDSINNLIKNNELETKDLTNITRSLKTISETQDETMKLLKIDSFKASQYDLNKVTLDELIKNTTTKNVKI